MKNVSRIVLGIMCLCLLTAGAALADDPVGRAKNRRVELVKQ